MKEQSCDQGTLEIELNAARAPIGGKERVVNDVAELVCTGYNTLMREQASSYRDRLSAVFGDVQAGGEYLGGFLVRFVDDGHSSHLGEGDSNDERGGRTPPPEADDAHVDVVFVPPSTGPS